MKEVKPPLQALFGGLFYLFETTRLKAFFCVSSLRTRHRKCLMNKREKNIQVADK
jgi:hypothetical protein